MPATDPPAQESPRSHARHVSGIRRLCEFALALVTVYGVLWGVTWGLLRWWWQPTPDGAATLAASLAQRSDDPSTRSILNALQRGDIYTFDQLQAAASALQQANTTAEFELIVTILGSLV